MKDIVALHDNYIQIEKAIKYIDENFKLTDIPERKDAENKYCETPNLSSEDQQMCAKLAEKEYKSRKSSTKLKTIKVESKPDWFDKNIDESIVSEEEQLEFEKKLKNMK